MSVLMIALVLLLAWSAQTSVPTWTNYALAVAFITVMVSHLFVIARHTGPRR